MKKVLNYLLFACLLSLLIISCKKTDDPSGNELPLHTTGEDIINPPDSFLLLFNLKTNINYSVDITFGDTSGSVWHILKENSYTARFWMSRTQDDSTLLIPDETIVGLQNDVPYTFYGNNNYYQDARKLIIRFEKLNYNYKTFDNKF